jgi:CDP-glucose 4,6-dehydratase
MGFRQCSMEDLVMTGAVTSNSAFWAGKRVLLTGHTGFKGSWLALWLNRLGAKVTAVSLPPIVEPNLFSLARIDELCQSHFCDVRDGDALFELIKAARPEIVLHLAAQPLVLTSYREPRDTFGTNMMGTVHVLDAVRRLDSVRAAVMVTTDKVYRNHEWPWPYREDDELGGKDPYSASKAASEIVIAGYRDAFLSAQGVAVASARAGNVIGGGNWSEDRLIPDAVRAWQAGRALDVRRPGATRPWQHVLEPLAGYLTLAQALWERPELAGAYNFGPDSGSVTTVRDLVEMARLAYGSGEVLYGDGSEGPHEAGMLALDVSKARAALGVTPRLALADAVRRTMYWYRARHHGANARALCETEIAAFEALS